MGSGLSTIRDVKLRVISVDPGTQKMGISFSIIDFSNNTFNVISSETIDIDRLVNVVNEQAVTEYQNKYSVMVNSVEKLFSEVLLQYQPDWVICESPYMNSRFPLPYALLTLCTETIRSATKSYSSSIGFSLVDPASVKKQLGVKGNSGDKLAVQNAIANNSFIVCNNFDIKSLDEHSSDSIAIGYYGFMEYLKEYNLLTK